MPAHDLQEVRKNQAGLAAFEIHFQVEWTRPPGTPKDLVTREVWRHDCLG